MFETEFFADWTTHSLLPYAFVCPICLRKLTECKLQKCSGCKLVFYCCKEHQLLHWPEHKVLCKAVKLMIKKTSDIGLFDDYVDKDIAMWGKFILSLINICESIIKRKLNHEETSLFLHPFCCKVCHTHKHNLMLTCLGCSVTSYCSEEHRDKDKSKHSRVCDKLKFGVDMSVNCHKVCSVNVSISDFTVLPEDMQTFIDKFVSVKTEPHIDKVYTSCVISNNLTVLLTLIFALEKSQIYVRKNSLTIHLVGSSSFESACWWCWEYMFHYFKNLSSINLVFIGPESSNLDVPPLLTCIDCRNSKSFNFIVESSLYHNYVEHSKHTPDLIVAFNCGFHEYEHNQNTWKDSMPDLVSFPETVVVFTSFTESESMEDLKVLKEFSRNNKYSVLVECEVNPFKSLVPLNDSVSEGSSVFYNNNFINILVT